MRKKPRIDTKVERRYAARFQKQVQEVPHAEEGVIYDAGRRL